MTSNEITASASGYRDVITRTLETLLLCGSTTLV